MWQLIDKTNVPPTSDINVHELLQKFQHLSTKLNLILGDPTLRPGIRDLLREVGEDAEHARNMVQESLVIDKYVGKYLFLSNQYPATITHDGAEYATVEHAYCAARCARAADRKKIQTMKPMKVRMLTSHMSRRPDWPTIGPGVLLELLEQKFEDKLLRSKLLATTPALILDTEGDLLMRIRKIAWEKYNDEMCGGAGEGQTDLRIPSAGGTTGQTPDGHPST